MQMMTVKEVLEATGGKLLSGDTDTNLYDVCTDSRNMKKNSLFVPLVGEKFDGHDYLHASFEMGAAAAIVHKNIDPLIGETIISVPDTGKALSDIARYYKKRCNIPTVAVTGSVGKTTTKDMIASVLSMAFKTHKTQDNFNNEIGVPHTVFGIEAEHEAAVIEMGMNHFGEIERLSSVVMPNVAVITNIGESHIEHLGSREGIFKAKMEVTKLFDAENTLIVNADDDYLSKTRGMGDYRVVYYGIKNPDSDIMAKNINNKGLDGIEFTASVYGHEYKIEVRVPGIHNVYNALASICAGLEFNVPMDKIVKGIRDFELTKMRMAIENIGGVQVINDCYNASPDSVRAALGVLRDTKTGRKVAVLGDILEMGDFAPEAHYKLGEAVARSGADLLVTAGENMKELARGAKEAGMENIVCFDKTLGASNFVKDEIKSGDTVLIKASRGMHFEEIYQAIKEMHSN